MATEIKQWYDTVPFIIGPQRKQKRIKEIPLKIQKLVGILYNVYEYGNPSLAKLIGIHKTPCAALIKHCDIKRRDNKSTTLRVRTIRSEKIKGDKNPRIYNDKNQYSTGIKGYYDSKNNGKVYFRSSWEYLYARWLDKNNINWKYEARQFKLKNGKYYRPDFFIYENNILKHVVEVKGADKTTLYKTNLLKNEYDIDVVVIDNIKPYCIQDYTTELKKWKQLQKSKE